MAPPNIKRVILTTAVVSITITGTLYGAGIKTNQEIAEVCNNQGEPKLSVHL
jgi:predicted secreted protein